MLSHPYQKITLPFIFTLMVGGAAFLTYKYSTHDLVGVQGTLAVFALFSPVIVIAIATIYLRGRKAGAWSLIARYILGFIGALFIAIGLAGIGFVIYKAQMTVEGIIFFMGMSALIAMLFKMGKIFVSRALTGEVKVEK